MGRGGEGQRVAEIIRAVDKFRVGNIGVSSRACCPRQKQGNLCIREWEKGHRSRLIGWGHNAALCRNAATNDFDALRQGTAAVRGLGNTPSPRWVRGERVRGGRFGF